MLLSSNILITNVPAEGKFRYRKRLIQATLKRRVQKQNKTLQTQCKITTATFLLSLYPILVMNKMINHLHGQ